MKIPKWLMSLSNVTANCDSCGYKEKIDIKNLTENDINNLLNKKCPICGHIMINIDDINVFKKMFKNFNIKESDKKNITYTTKKH